jgi:hypothetical protein
MAEVSDIYEFSGVTPTREGAAIEDLQANSGYFNHIETVFLAESNLYECSNGTST